MRRVAVIGGGAAGFFAAVTAARLGGNEVEVTVLERGRELLSKVRISGGGRCNVTHACFDPREFARNYPRGERQLRGAFHRFQAGDTVKWFESRGVRLKTEEDGRMFPVTDSSSTIIDCLLSEADETGVRIRTNAGVKRIHPVESGWQLELESGEVVNADRVVVASGGCRSVEWFAGLDQQIVTPVPSLFTFHLSQDCWLRQLPGVAVGKVRIRAPGTNLAAEGAFLITHQGLSGPAVLRLSAWGAREWHARGYQFPIRIDWLPDESEAGLRAWFARQRAKSPGKKPSNTPPCGMPHRLWEAMVAQSGVSEEVRWATLPRATVNRLVETLRRGELEVVGKSMNKEEFVTCGGVALQGVDFRTMESRSHPGLYFAGEVLDIDGVTGGFNFQAAWTTGWIAGHAVVQSPDEA